ncbi:maltase 2 [Bemisia tabaci]|uniref:maltase 2 n=1 Tax=Bemisia tabaci TaxID=7038 RepID=UPI0008F9B28F|nr:PREDICTED: maltase 2-like [Bemisia tabaci]
MGTFIQIAAALCVLLSSTRCELLKAIPQRDLEWWERGIIYQIYPRSFKDSDGDGVGDLKGIVEKVGYLAKLGIKAVWISPIFKSPMADFGYDIADYRAIEQIFGTMQDLENLKDLLHENGLKLILDFVPNHTSDEHEWFKKSVSRQEPYTDYYVWQDAKVVNGRMFPPNNWLSDFGGSAWTWNEDRQQYFLHQFHPKQPDLNYRNPLVVQEMKDVLTFWMDRGVDGFRMDAVMTIFEDELLRDNPRSNNPDALPTDQQYLNPIYSRDQPETYDVIKEFRKLLDDYSAKTNTVRFMATEAYSNITQTMKYYGTEDEPGAHFTFNFLFITSLSQQSSARDFKRIIELWYSNLPIGKWSNWVIGNHDQRRVASRYGIDMLDGLHMMQMVLPGTSVSYMGDEIGMEDTFIRWDQTLDPPALNAGPERYLRFTRDPARTPFQWGTCTSGGFSKNKKTWLPVNPRYWTHNLETEKRNKRSHFKNYQKLVALKEAPVIQFGNLKVYALTKWVLVITRSLPGHPTIIVIANLGTEFENTANLSSIAKLPETIKLNICSVNCAYVPGIMLYTDKIHLRPKAAMVCSTQSGSSRQVNDIYADILSDFPEE